MQRVLSLETSRNDNTGTEYVSKRLCFSILFSISFLFLLAGYLLGRYTTDRAILLRQAYVRQKLLLDEKNPMEILKNISESVKTINQITLEYTSAVNLTRVYEELLCKKKTELPSPKDFEEDMNLVVTKMLAAQLESLSACYGKVEKLLISIPKNSD